jgi:hypothetical protein
MSEFFVETGQFFRYSNQDYNLYFVAGISGEPGAERKVKLVVVDDEMSVSGVGSISSGRVNLIKIGEVDVDPELCTPIELADMQKPSREKARAILNKL